jgi:hypothetical protein
MNSFATTISLTPSPIHGSLKLREHPAELQEGDLLVLNPANALCFRRKWSNIFDFDIDTESVHARHASIGSNCLGFGRDAHPAAIAYLVSLLTGFDLVPESPGPNLPGFHIFRLVMPSETER